MNTVHRIAERCGDPSMFAFTRSDWIVLIALVALLALTGGEPGSEPSSRADEGREPATPRLPRGHPLACGDLWL
jgi:hypothetical protein